VSDSYETFFPHNWVESVEVESRWQTAVDVARETLAEDRVSLVDRPSKEITFRWTGLSKAEVWKLQQRLHEATAGGMLLPLYCDQSETTAVSPAAGATLNCPTDDYRFTAGGLCVAVAFDKERRLSFMQSFNVTVVGVASLTVSPNVATAFPAGSVVFPAYYSDEILESQFLFQNDGTCNVTLKVLAQAHEDNETFAAATAGVTPAGFSTFGGLPIFDLEPDWADGIDFGLVRQAEVHQIASGTAVQERGPQAQFTLSVSMLQFTREEAVDVIRFFDSRGGAYASFYMANPVAMFEPIDIDPGFVDVEAFDTDTDWATDFLSHVAVVLWDGTHHIRAVSSVTQNVDEWRIAFATVIPAMTLADIRRVAPAYLVRFKEDVLLEQWLTDDKCRMSFSVQQLVNERVAEVP
jgi:hypothetical protein